MASEGLWVWMEQCALHPGPGCSMHSRCSRNIHPSLHTATDFPPIFLLLSRAGLSWQAQPRGIESSSLTLNLKQGLQRWLEAGKGKGGGRTGATSADSIRMAGDFPSLELGWVPAGTLESLLQTHSQRPSQPVPQD